MAGQGRGEPGANKESCHSGRSLLRGVLICLSAASCSRSPIRKSCHLNGCCTLEPAGWPTHTTRPNRPVARSGGCVRSMSISLKFRSATGEFSWPFRQLG